ncbi:MAG: MFS transporter [Anaerolineae bacterium]
MNATATYLDQSTERSNYRHLVMDIAWFGLALATTSRFLSVYAIQLNASAMELAWITALPSLVMMFSSSLAVWWRRRFTNTIQAMFWPSLGFRLSFLLLVFTPYLPVELQPWWLIVSVTLPAVPQGIGSVLFLVMMREAVQSERLASLVSRRSTAMNVTVAISAVACGFWLENVAFPLNYQIIFFLGFVATLVSLWHVQRVRLQSQIIPPPAPTERRTNSWRYPGAWKSAAMTMITHVVYFAILPLTPLYLVDEMGASEGFMAMFGLMELAAGAIMALFTGQMVRTIGNRSTAAIGMVGTAASVVFIAFAPALWMTLISAIVLGASWTAAGIGVFGYVNEQARGEGAGPAHMTVHLQTFALAAFVGPLVASQLVEWGVDLVAVLLLGAASRLVVGAMIVLPWHRVKDARAAQFITRALF